MLGQVGMNSNGGAVFIYEHEGARKQAFFVPRGFVSLTRAGAESSFDFEKQLFSAATREMSFAQSFFQRLARAMETAARFPREPAGDVSEYDEEEVKQALWKKLGVTARSRFLNVAADNHVTWPNEPTLVKFDNHHFVLMPRTKDNVQSVHMDLVANRLDHGGATTVLRRFLSLMAWCDNNLQRSVLGGQGTLCRSQ